jgi:predicted ATP-grasp superfamily ATP-dependent carboligase
MKGYDKNQLMKVCKELGVAHPMTVDLAEDYTLSGMKYPAIIKPNLTTGGRGMSIVNNQGELEAIIEPTIEKYGNSHVQEFVPAGGRQIKVQLLVDDSQNLLSSSVMCKKRMYPVKGGSSCCNVTMRNEELISTCHQVLKTIEWRGFADFDIIEDPRDNSLKIMEINPRIPACIKSTVAAGIDWGEAIVCEALDHPVPAYSYREGVVLRYLGFDVLWFLKSDDRFKAKPSWFKFFGSNVSYEDVDITDIKSFIMGTYGNIKKLLDPNFRAAKSGTN